MIKKYRAFLVLFSLFFLMVEIWEPSTDFVRATISDPGAITLNQNLIINSPSDQSKMESALLEKSLLISADSDIFGLAHADDQGVAHCADSLVIFEITNIRIMISFIFYKSYDRLDGYFTLIKHPPILS